MDCLLCSKPELINSSKGRQIDSILKNGGGSASEGFAEHYQCPWFSQQEQVSVHASGTKLEARP